MRHKEIPLIWMLGYGRKGLTIYAHIERGCRIVYYDVFNVYVLYADILTLLGCPRPRNRINFIIKNKTSPQCLEQLIVTAKEETFHRRSAYKSSGNSEVIKI